MSFQFSKGSGSFADLRVWRIESAFNVKELEKEDFGTFYSGQCYVVLSKRVANTRKTDSFTWNYHYWIGKESKPDEQHTAQAMADELEHTEKIGGMIVHKEVQGHESDLFRSYFPPAIRVFQGGSDSGFDIRNPQKYVPRLLWVCKKGNNHGRKRIEVTEVPCKSSSLYSGDAFILDAGLTIFQWNGAGCQPFERNKAAEILRSMGSARSEMPKTVVLEENFDDDKTFWDLLGGKEGYDPHAVAPEDSGDDGDDDDDTQQHQRREIRRLFRLSDASGKLQIREEAFNTSVLHPDDIFIIDIGAEVFVWVGERSNENERSNAITYAEEYITAFDRPSWLSITRLLPGQESEALNSVLTANSVSTTTAQQIEAEKASAKIQALYVGFTSKKVKQIQDNSLLKGFFFGKRSPKQQQQQQLEGSTNITTAATTAGVSASTTITNTTTTEAEEVGSTTATSSVAQHQRDDTPKESADQKEEEEEEPLIESSHSSIIIPPGHSPTRSSKSNLASDVDPAAFDALNNNDNNNSGLSSSSSSSEHARAVSSSAALLDYSEIKKKDEQIAQLENNYNKMFERTQELELALTRERQELQREREAREELAERVHQLQRILDAERLVTDRQGKEIARLAELLKARTSENDDLGKKLVATTKAIETLKAERDNDKSVFEQNVASMQEKHRMLVEEDLVLKKRLYHHTFLAIKLSMNLNFDLPEMIQQAMEESVKFEDIYDWLNEKLCLNSSSPSRRKSRIIKQEKQHDLPAI